MRLPIYDINGKRTEDILEIDDQIFGGEVKDVVLKEAIIMYEARQRVGTHCTKTRGDVAGSHGKKLWRQKGTGRARVSNAHAPHWRGGGVCYGPRPRDYSYSIPKTAKKAALESAWFAKFRDHEVLVIEDLSADSPKTKKMATLLKSLGVLGRRTLIGLMERQDNLWRSARNIPYVSMDLVSCFSPYSLIANDKILITKKTLEALVSDRGGTIKTLKRSEVYKKA